MTGFVDGVVAFGRAVRDAAANREREEYVRRLYPLDDAGWAEVLALIRADARPFAACVEWHAKTVWIRSKKTGVA